MKLYAYPHAPILFQYAQSIERFFVEELPPFTFYGSGPYLILKVKKQDLSTWRLLHVLSSALHVSENAIGYGGLKDKNATAIQYVSLPRECEAHLDNLITERIEILERTYHKRGIKMGELGANRFVIRLDHVTPQAATAFESAANAMVKGGFPNYFGYQRFGEDGKSHEQGKKIAHSGKKLKGAKEKLLVSAYQAYLFNNWLDARVHISQVINAHDAAKAAKMLAYPIALTQELRKQKQFFKLFLGECMNPYPDGKGYYCGDMSKEAEQFAKAQSVPTGLLCGSHIIRSRSDARHLEEPFDDEDLASLKGERRAAWVWPTDLSFRYEAEKKQLHASFTLPKGSYATAFLEQIGKRPLVPAKAGMN